MTLRFDPENIEHFKSQIRSIPGYPTGEELPIRAMVFESGAIWRLPELLQQAGATTENPLAVVMDRASMRREGQDLKPLVLEQVEKAGWRVDVIWLESDSTGQVHTDFPQINSVKARLTPDSAVLSVGSGTVTDNANHACH